MDVYWKMVDFHTKMVDVIGKSGISLENGGIRFWQTLMLWENYNLLYNVNRVSLYRPFSRAMAVYQRVTCFFWGKLT